MRRDVRVSRFDLDGAGFLVIGVAAISGSSVLARLTPAERRVATLAAAGLRNREIAARCGVSTHTVANQLRQACLRLGVRGRRELTVALARGGAGDAE